MFELLHNVIMLSICLLRMLLLRHFRWLIFVLVDFYVSRIAQKL